MKPLIEFDQVVKTFTTSAGPVKAVEGVDLQVMRGQFVTLVGPSGCGKSTLLNMTAGLFHPSSGQVRYDGAPVPQFNRRTGYMTQNDHLLPWRDVAGNIAVPLEIVGLPREQIRERVARLMEMVGLTGFETSYPVQLSGGMRKRAALARLLAYDPETLLLDEPFAALDAQLRLRMQIELLQIARRLDKTVLFVTHDLDEAVALADRIVVFSGRPGRIVRVVESVLPRDRDLMGLRRSVEYNAQTAELWELLAPAVEEVR
ncbi:ABC transporter ATP-binding protein [Roseateles toxinivorans]|uniref:NitT/TauT family transport system ATP-binding protein n=1 Tax=Roseateles toxinivorans TaxID=270368 RepID=A0A4R6QIU0_9BURK|nr:ABC transporter ATP-binding protein [Roseateles toxinivorans]TDP62055.1 NitT/TauT family transport system ATP-binding protein [Roseateles toxinivorans]